MRNDNAYGIAYPETETAIDQNNVLNMKCFIIPRGAMSYKKMEENVSRDYREMIQADTTEQLSVLGIEHDKDDFFIPTWFHCEGHTNLTDHGYGPVLCEFLGIEWDPQRPTLMKRDAPHLMPYQVLKDVKEGDTKTFTTRNGKTVKITFQQKGYRYDHRGTFDEIVKDLVKGA